MNRESRRAFARAANSVSGAFERAGPFPDQEVTLPLLAEAITQCLEIATDDAQEGMLNAEEAAQVGTHALECISDLALWAFQLGLDQERCVIEDLALDFARWMARCGARISVLEPVVNTLARRANATRDPAQLVPLMEAAREVIEHADPVSTVAAVSGGPWQILNFNLAIIATRTQQPQLMQAAFDLLEHNLPDACPAFYAEGLRQAEQKACAPHVRDIMRQRALKWTTLH
jgi:hypothetical protein